jgi:anti-sigma28 factor (negative regulator of flagellin synthesis)
MSIEPIRPGNAPNAGQPASPTRADKAATPASTHGQDTVELSPEARQLQEAEQRERLERIRQRIGSGFYSTPEVLRHVAERILEELGSPTR